MSQETSDLWAAPGMFLGNRPVEEKTQVREPKANLGHPSLF
jgi:hypothetical protein